MGKKHSKKSHDRSPRQNQPTTRPTDTDDQPSEGNMAQALPLTNAWLPLIVDTGNGLLDELLNRGVLNQQQIELIEGQLTNESCSSQLLHEVNKLSRDKKEQFLLAVDKTKQSHVTNFIRSNVQRTTAAVDQNDNWPIPNEIVLMEQNRSKLIELLDTRNGLCIELLSAQCITNQEKDRICQFNLMADRNQQLMYIIRRKGRHNFRKFLDCLIKTKQHHVAALLDPNIAQNVQPVNETQIAMLIKNYSTLVQLIELKHSGLIGELLSADIITWYHKDFIESAPTASESNERLLDCMKRGNQQDFDKFSKCLDKTGQKHVADLLRSDGMVAEVIASTNLPIVDETAIVDGFFSFYRSTSPQTRRKLRRELDILDRIHDSRLIAMQTGHSIELFVICRSLSGLLHLNELYSTGKLETIVQQLFTVLSKNERQSVVVRRLVWNLANYNNCVQNLSSSSSLPIYAHIHELELAQHRLPDVSVEHSVFTQAVEILPHELIELLIIKAAGRLFASLKTMTSRADVHTLTTLNSVSHYWWNTLTYRPKNRQLLKQFFERSCAPYRYIPKLVNNLCIQGCFIRGVAELDHKAYIVTEMSNTVRVWSLVQSSFRPLEIDIKLPELINPVDIVACSMTRCLYISDSKTRCIWRVNLSTSFKETGVEKFITLDFEPLTLSVQSNRLLVMEYAGRTLCVYSCHDGALVRKIERNNDDVIDDDDLDEAHTRIDRLLRNVLPLYAAETSLGSLVLCHRPRYLGDEKHRPGVSEVSVDGYVRRTYTGAMEYNLHRYLTLDSGNNVLVSDYRNRQILHLNSQLEIQQVLLTELTGQPDRLCYSQQTGLLYICYYASPNIDVFRVTVRG